MHSPGPWYWGLDDESHSYSQLVDARDYAVLRPVLESIHGGIGPVYQHLTGEPPDCRLIAAAPDLLAVCRELCDYLEAGDYPQGMTQEAGFSHIYGTDGWKLFEAAKAAIAKTENSAQFPAATLAGAPKQPTEAG